MQIDGKKIVSWDDIKELEKRQKAAPVVLIIMFALGALLAIFLIHNLIIKLVAVALIIVLLIVFLVATKPAKDYSRIYFLKKAITGKEEVERPMDDDGQYRNDYFFEFGDYKRVRCSKDYYLEYETGSEFFLLINESNNSVMGIYPTDKYIIPEDFDLREE
ncbi:MAG: hypothetical protein K5669_02760 [Lachnospiraceae bacterium]|nr:hypothetical protein [Lachnospiraceae bacterium]